MWRFSYCGPVVVRLTCVLQCREWVYQWRSQVIGIGRALAVSLTIELATLALAHTRVR